MVILLKEGNSRPSNRVENPILRLYFFNSRPESKYMKRLVFKKRAKKREPAPTSPGLGLSASYFVEIENAGLRVRVAYYIDLVSDDAATSENKEVIT